MWHPATFNGTLMNVDWILLKRLSIFRYRDLWNAYSRSGEALLPFVTLGFNIDGVEMAASAIKSIYPVMLSINELPSGLRGDTLVLPLLFLKTREEKFHHKMLATLVDDLNELSTNGVNILVCAIHCVCLCNSLWVCVTRFWIFSLRSDSERKRKALSKEIHICLVIVRGGMW